MPNPNNEKTWKDLHEELHQIMRKENFVTIRNVLDGIIICAEQAKDFDAFIENLKMFRGKCNDEVNK